MSWPGFYALGGAWLFLLIGPLVLLYFLKLKRPRQEVPSLVLWRQVLNDNRVNSPLQKFKRNLLLLLQLLLLCAIVLAAMQPYMRGNVSDVQRLPILIDTSASMGALDRQGGTSRLEAARQQVHRMIDGLGSRQEIALIAFSRTARKLTDFTSNKRILRDALDALVVEDVPSDIEDALRMTAALAQTEPFERVLLLSDGNFPARADFPLPFRLEYQQLPPAGPNFGITAFNARRAGDNQWDVFASIEGSQNVTGGSPVTATLELFQDGEPVTTPQQLVIAPGQLQRLAWSVQGASATSLELRLTTDAFDALLSDNRAYLDLAPARPVWVYIPDSLHRHRLAFGAMSGVRVFPAAGAATPASFDIIVSDDPADLDRTAPTRMFINIIPPELNELITLRDEPSLVVDWQRNDELLRYLQLDDHVLMKQPAWAPEVGEAELEARGFEVLVYGQSGPLLLRHRNNEDVTYYQLFHTHDSTQHYSIYFVMMLQNLVDIAMHQAGLSETTAQSTGVLPPLKVSPQQRYRVRPPRGESRTMQSDARSQLQGIAAPYVGRYVVEETGLSGSAVATVGASLVSARESSLYAEPTVEFREQSVQAAAAEVKTDHAYWRTVLMIALGVMVVEWWYFQRKPY